MAYKIHIKVISVQHVLTWRLVTLVMTYHTAAMLDYECLNCCWVKTHMLDETIVVENMGMGR